MIYRPAEPRSLWGFWIIEWNGEFHVFYDEDVNANYDVLSWQKNHDHVGHAVSEDLVHWESRPSLCVRGKKGEWNEMAAGGMKTGCVARYGDKFHMYVGAMQSDGVQVIGLWTSTDLENWEQHPDNPVLKPAGPHYLEAVTADRGSVSWRDPGITYNHDDKCFHMCISAMAKERGSSHTLGSVIGHVRSRDLVHWEHLPPFETPGLLDRFYQNEEAEMFAIDGRHYIIFDGGTTGGMRVNTPFRDDVRGSFYMMSPTLEGPYVLPEDDFLMGSSLGARCATTGRVVPYRGKNIFFHFSIAKRPVLGLPKELRTRPDGTLYLEYMPELEKLETEIICGSIKDLPESKTPDSGRWQRTDEELTCDVKLGGSVHKVAEDVTDCHLACTIKSESAKRAGVVVRIDREADAGIFPRGVGIILDFERQKMFISDANCYPKTGWYCRELEICRMPLAWDRAYRLRCFVREEHLEVYLDDHWVFTTILPETGKLSDNYRRHYRWGPGVPRSGAIELMAESGKAVFADLRLAVIEPL